jgi:hypothetical protein
MISNKEHIVVQVCPPLDNELVGGLIDEFISQERRYVLGDWEPATLDGGQFAEIASRIVYHVDSGNLSRRKSVDSCLKYVEDENNSNSYTFPQRRTALHLSKVIRTIYKFRSQRGAVHIDPDYTANELDAALVISNVRWVMAELLRVFWNGDRIEVGRIIKEIVRFDVPAVLSRDDRKLVLRTDCSVAEEIIILLHNAGASGMNREELGRSIPRRAPTISNALRRLGPTERREVVRKTAGQFILTPLGMKRVREELSAKLGLSV